MPGWIFLLLVIWPAIAGAADSHAMARQEFLREMRKKSPEARVAAVEAYARFPIAETADSLFRKGLADPDPTVRSATRKAIRTAAAAPDAFPYFADEFSKFTRRQSNTEMLTGLLGGMVASTRQEHQEQTLRALKEYLALPRASLAIPMQLLDDLALDPGPDLVPTIQLLMQIDAFRTEFGYRRCVVQALIRSRNPAAIPVLIEILGGADGLVQAEIVDHLEQVTDQTFRENARDWSDWWMRRGDGFTFPTQRVPRPRPPGESSYYGIPICAKRVVFVLDTSVSMRGVPMEAAKRALLATVESLPESVHFDIILFDRTATVWQPRLVPATPAFKRQAAESVWNRGMQVGTASHAAINAAFGLDPEVIYFLSDGEPTDNKPDQIVESMTERNRIRRISIHTVGVVTQGGAGGLKFFMKPLAELNYGTFQLVE